MTDSSPAVSDRPEASRYELAVDGEVAFLSYRRRDDHVLLSHTEVPEALRGRGLGTVLARHALDEARRQEKQVIVKCPFVTAWLRTNHDYDDIVIARVSEDGDVRRQSPPGPR